jgi:(p)ppGpp synthase/HD superfamily hydrolase
VSVPKRCRKCSKRDRRERSGRHGRWRLLGGGTGVRRAGALIPGVFTAGKDDRVERFAAALVYTTEVHELQRRKGTEIPYLAHLLAVASLVLEDGGDEDEAIAGLLHDAIEDTDVTFDDLTARFGPKVAEIVQGCSDTDVKPKPPWRARKEAYLVHLIDARPEVVRVSLADKVHNARSVLFDYRLMGEELWARFNPDADQLWYYRSLVEVFRRVSRSPLVDELDRAVTELEGLTRHAPDTDT